MGQYGSKFRKGKGKASWRNSENKRGNMKKNLEAHGAAEAEKSASEKKVMKADAEKVFGFFREISSIPRGSCHTEAISDYLVAFAKERGLEYVQDTANNVIIRKGASEGAAQADPIALQGHIDMVLASRPDKDIDMLTTPVSILVEGDWMHADGTTLGADNGIAVAMMLAILDSDQYLHPGLECIFTSDEEVGLIGATRIDLSGLRSRRLLNLDSEKEGVFCAGCAGGSEVICEMPLKRKERTGHILKLELSGLRGGHSGCDIHIGGANANVLMSRALYGLCDQIPFRLISIDGGDANNAIATGAKAQILLRREEDKEKVLSVLGEITRTLSKEYKVTDPGMSWNAAWESDESGKAVSKKGTRIALEYLISLPNGVTAMNPVLQNEPQTSLNLGVLRTQKNGIMADFLVRSGLNSQRVYLSERLLSITKAYGGNARVSMPYPAWEFRKDSPFRELALDVYKKVSGREGRVEVIHAGLECGILSGKVEGLDCISAGPDLENVHTAAERMSISSVERVWTFVLALLAEAVAR